MQNLAHATFLRHLPPALQDGLSIKTKSGTLISLQTILRIDHEFVAIKGRISGTQDAGRVFFVPYDQIDHFYYQKELREEEFNAAFEGLRMPDPTAAVPPPVDAPVDEEDLSANSAPINRPTAIPIKSAILERFRSRSGSSSPGTSSRSPQG
jgi:hypothetical protein